MASLIVPQAPARTVLLLRLAAFTIALMCSVTVAHTAAQAVYGSVRGTITDSSGAVLPGTTVTITSKARNTSDTVVTDSEGVYTKERLLPGVGRSRQVELRFLLLRRLRRRLLLSRRRLSQGGSLR